MTSGSCDARPCSINCAAPLCDAVVGEPGAQERLRKLEASSLFLVPLDRRREWYRYHGLFREFLLGELRRVEPDVITKLHLRAADWYESNGWPAMAVEHLLNTDERDRCSQLVTALVLPTYRGRPTVDRAALAVGTRRRARSRNTRRWPCSPAGSRCSPGRPPKRNGGRRSSTPASFDLVPARRLGVVRLGTGDAAGDDVPRRSGADAGRRRASRSPKSRNGASGATRHLPVRRGAPAHRRRRPGRCRCSRRRPPRQSTSGNTDSLVVSEAELAVAGDGSWAVGRKRPSTSNGHSGAHREHQMHDYPTSGARLRRRGPARRAPRRPQRAEPPADPGDASPSVADVRDAVSRRAGHDCNWPRCTGRIADQTTARHLLHEIDDILLHRPALGTLVDEVAAFRQGHHLGARRQRAARHRSPLRSCGCSRTSRPTTPSATSPQRLFVSRNTVNSQVSSIYRKLGVSSRDEAVQRAIATGLLGG